MMHKILFAALVCAAFGLSAAPVAPETVATKGAKVEDGTVVQTVKNNRFCVVEFKLPEKIAFDPALTLSFEYRLTTTAEKPTIVAQLRSGKKLTWASFPANSEWQKLKVPFSKARYESAFGGKRPENGELIDGLKFYGRTQQRADIKLELRNIEISGPAAK